jgi:hypothetical protein
MTIRLAEPEDLARIVEMAVLFIAESPYGRIAPAVPDRIIELAKKLASSPDGVIFVVEVDGNAVGMLGGHIFDHPMLDAIVASEVAWWVDMAHRGRVGVKLLAAFEQWARDHGATHVEMVSPDSDSVGRFYERVGYSRIETAYLRRV